MRDVSTMNEKLSERLEKWIKEDKPYCQVGFCEELCGEASGEKCGSYTLCHSVQDIRDLESHLESSKTKLKGCRECYLSFPQSRRQWDDTWVYDTEEIDKWKNGLMVQVREKKK
jgi:hypothetical protein